MRMKSMGSDTQTYIKALYDLDGMATPVDSGFELEFISDNIDRVAEWEDRTSFSPKQKTVIRNMVAKYLGEHRLAEMLG